MGEMYLEASDSEHPQENNYESDYKVGWSPPCAGNYTTICTHCRGHMVYGVTHIWIIAEICIIVTVAKHNYSVHNMMECKGRSVWRGGEGREAVIMQHGDESSLCHDVNNLLSEFKLCVCPRCSSDNMLLLITTKRSILQCIIFQEVLIQYEFV